MLSKTATPRRVSITYSARRSPGCGRRSTTPVRARRSIRAVIVPGARMTRWPRSRWVSRYGFPFRRSAARISKSARVRPSARRYASSRETISSVATFRRPTTAKGVTSRSGRSRFQSRSARSTRFDTPRYTGRNRRHLRAVNSDTNSSYTNNILRFLRRSK